MVGIQITGHFSARRAFARIFDPATLECRRNQPVCGHLLGVLFSPLHDAHTIPASPIAGIAVAGIPRGVIIRLLLSLAFRARLGDWSALIAIRNDCSAGRAFCGFGIVLHCVLQLIAWYNTC